MTWEWQRLKTPSGLRSRGCAGLIAPKYGMKLSTKLGLRLHLYLGGQRVCTTPLSSENLFLLAQGLIPPLR